MNATCRPFSIATSAAISATIVLPEPTSPCSSRFIGCGRFMSPTISRDRLLLIAGQLERQDPPRRLADLVGDHHRPRLALGVGSAAPQHDAQLEEEELLEDQPAVRVGSERVQRVEAGALRREVHVRERAPPIDQLLRAAGRRAGSGSGSSAGSCASAWCTSARCILVVSVPVFS